ncbi:MAG TPA: glycerate kinase [Phycisphaerae bacterium]|nr:glycerate kinase [Phycisphaerae bacterium]
MRIVIAPDSFKECLSAAEVAAALAEGARDACPDARIELCPMADGGEGTVAAMVAATGGEARSVRVSGPLGEPRTAELGLLGDGRTAVIEMAAASGLDLVPPARRNPMLTTTRGTGELIRAALDAGAGEVLVGIGGSATVDGGCGCAQALGVRFLDASGAACAPGLGGGALAGIRRIDLAGRDPRVAEARFRVACDVTNPLTGPDGAAAVYGPQKGATPEMVQRLDAGLAHLAGLIRRDLGVDVEPLPGAGAAGGLGAGLVAFLGAELRRGVVIVAEAVRLAQRLAGADLCLTGEGRFDRQSLSGKTAVGVARVARDAAVPVICIPGQAEAGLDHGGLFADVRPLVAGDVRVAEALARPRDLLRLRVAEALAAFLAR